MTKITYIYLFVLLLLVSCKKDKSTEPDAYQPTPYYLQIPKGFPTNLNIPADNPLTVEGIQLGRYLFYDGRLSGREDSLMSCASCHKQKYCFTPGIENTKYSKEGKTYGLTGIPTAHKAMPLVNLVWNNSGYLWNGMIYSTNSKKNLRNIEDIVSIAISLAEEMHGDSNKTKALLQRIPIYPPMFKKAFGDEEITMRNISRAIAQFLRILISADSKFDKYLRGEGSLTISELQGLQLFLTETGADCFHCHGSAGNPLLTTHLFYNNAKDTCFTTECGNLFDRSYITNNNTDIGAFRAPTLRNISVRAPYMHDGRFSNLDQVLNFYNSGLKYSPYASPLMHHIGMGGIRLNPTNLSNLKAFLETLSDNEFLTNPAFSNPCPEDSFFIND